jgi:hypothetical protein
MVGNQSKATSENIDQPEMVAAGLRPTCSLAINLLTKGDTG